MLQCPGVRLASRSIFWCWTATGKSWSAFHWSWGPATLPSLQPALPCLRICALGTSRCPALNNPLLIGAHSLAAVVQMSCPAVHAMRALPSELLFDWETTTVSCNRCFCKSTSSSDWTASTSADPPCDLLLVNGLLGHMVVHQLIPALLNGLTKRCPAIVGKQGSSLCCDVGLPGVNRHVLRSHDVLTVFQQHTQNRRLELAILTTTPAAVTTGYVLFLMILGYCQLRRSQALAPLESKIITCHRRWCSATTLLGETTVLCQAYLTSTGDGLFLPCPGQVSRS